MSWRMLDMERLMDMMVSVRLSVSPFIALYDIYSDEKDWMWYKLDKAFSVLPKGQLVK
jgi:hypothetical protein